MSVAWPSMVTEVKILGGTMFGSGKLFGERLGHECPRYISRMDIHVRRMAKHGD